MAKLSRFERLDLAVAKLFVRTDALPSRIEADIAPLVHLAGELRGMPRDEFIQRLGIDL